MFHVSRREVLRRAAATAGAGALAVGSGWCGGRPALGAAAGDAPPAPPPPPFELTVIRGNARERGRAYGGRFKDAIAGFFDCEIFRAFTGNPSSREDMLRYAAACAARIKAFAPEVMDELEGMAEGAGLRLEHVVLLTLHEELFHRGVLPTSDAAGARAGKPREGHCTVLAAGPPATADGDAYVGQTWDWMSTTYGHSAMLRWERPNGPSARQMTRTPDGGAVEHTDRCRRMFDLLNAGGGPRLDRAALQRFLHDPAVYVPRNDGAGVFTVDQMLFNTTRREAYVKRGPAAADGWQRFGFSDPA